MVEVGNEAVSLEIDSLTGISFELDVDEFVNDRLAEDDMVTRLWQQYLADDGPSDFDSFEQFPAWLRSHGWSVTSPWWYDEGSEDLPIVNTYNYDSLLSRGLQFMVFVIDSLDPDDDIFPQEVVLLSRHLGTDVRWGYGDCSPYVPKESSSDMLDYDRGTIACQNDREHYWTTDDGYHWYFQGSTLGRELQNYPGVPVEDVTQDQKDRLIGHGILAYADGIGYCPLCGGQLVPLPY